MQKRLRKKLRQLFAGLTLGIMLGVILTFIYITRNGLDKAIDMALSWGIGILLFGVVTTTGTIIWLKKKRLFKV